MLRAINASMFRIPTFHRISFQWQLLKFWIYLCICMLYFALPSISTADYNYERSRHHVSLRRDCALCMCMCNQRNILSWNINKLHRCFSSSWNSRRFARSIVFSSIAVADTSYNCAKEKKMKNQLLSILIVIQCYAVASYKILSVFPTISPSHYYVGRALMKGLAADGHEVTMISPFKEKNQIPNYNEVYLDGVYDQAVNGSFDSNVAN